MPSRCRQNFSSEAEAAINEQINLELTASYVYQSMAAYFAHDSVALCGLSHRFRKESDEERSHANMLIDYLTKRGGHLALKAIEAPRMDWQSAKFALESALDLEKRVNDSLLKLHALASSLDDPHLSDFIEEEFLEDQVEGLKELAELLTRLERCGCDGLGLHIFDRDLSSEK
jgi:ferritin heavy chain